MNVSKIFKTLIIVVLCVVLGAFALNTLLPNVVAGACNVIENGIKGATGIEFDLNGDGVGTSNTNATADEQVNGGVGVQGFEAVGGTGN